MSETDPNEWRMTDEKLQQRLNKVERGLLCQQSLMVFAVSLGSFAFGNIISWGAPALEHIPELITDQSTFDKEYAWLLTLSPLVAGLSLLVWAFIDERIGARNTIILQTLPLLVGWALKAYFNTLYYYTAGHIIIAFCSISYLYSGASLVTECVHRNNIIIFFVIFRAANMLGVLCMDVIGAALPRFWLCHFCAAFSFIPFVMLWFLPNSPVYYMKRGRPTKAENSLKYYLGNQSIGNELNVIRQHVFLLGTSQNSMHMLSKKVVLKAICILFFLQLFRTMSGFYAFVLSGVVIFRQTNSIINPYVDNIIYGISVFLSRLIISYVVLKRRHKIGIKVLLLLASILMSTVLYTLAFSLFYRVEIGSEWLPQISLCSFGIAYHIGFDIIPEILTYEYLPYQIYNFMVKVMYITHWMLVAGVVRGYLLLQNEYDTYVPLFVLAGVSTLGIFFIGIFVVETKGKSLTNIQLELGANPVGSRGSQRQRIGNPYEINEGPNYLRNLIQKFAFNRLTPRRSRRLRDSHSDNKSNIQAEET